MDSVNFYRTYHLHEGYTHAKEHAENILGKYLDYPDLYNFNNEEKALIFKSERLIPLNYSGRPKVMLLFSNPHPHSVHQGMLLSPNTRGRKNSFWETMRNAGWVKFKKETIDPLQMANLCFNTEYEGPFDFIFYPYYTFPTNYPNEIKMIFGRDFFNQVIEPEAEFEFKKTIRETCVDAVVAFNKDIYNLVSVENINKSMERLINGGLIHSQVKDIEEKLPIFLTFPTGWRYHKDIKLLKKESLDLINEKISTSSD